MKLSSLNYRLLPSVNKEIKDLLSKTVYGTDKGLRIRHLDTSWKLDFLFQPDFHCLYDNENLIAVAVYCKREVSIGSSLDKIDAYYIRYFSVKDEYQNHRIGNLLTEKTVEYYKQNLTVPTLFYAYIEGENLKSQAVSKHFNPTIIGSFSPIYLSRFNPKNKGHSEIKSYSYKNDYNFKYHLRRNDQTVLLGNQSKPRAVISYQKVKWEIPNYPKNNFLMQKVLPKAPYLGKIAEGQFLNFIAVTDFEFLTLSDLMELGESILNKEGLNKLMFYVDTSSTEFNSMNEYANLGFMSKIQKAPKINILLFHHLLDEATLEFVKKSPTYINGFDIT